MNATVFLNVQVMTITRAPARRSLTVGIVLTREFTLGALGNFIDVLRLAADEGDRSRPLRCGWTIVSGGMRALRSSSGVLVEPDEPPGDPRRFDYVAVVGGLIDADQLPDPEAARFLSRAAAQGVPLIGICTGTFILQRMGLLTGYRACVNWFHHDDFLAEFDGVEPVSDRIFVVDRDRLTCSGGVSAAQLAAFLVERHVGAAAARKALAIMIIDDLHGADQPQP